MRIDTLLLTNFRCFSERNFRLHPQMNMLTGPNGAGKTAILEALSVAAGSWLLGIGGFQARHIRSGDIRLAPIHFEGELTFEGQFPVVVGAEGSIDGQWIEWQRTLATGDSRTSYGGARRLRDVATKADVAVRRGEPVILPVIAYYGSGRLWLEPRDSSIKQASTAQAKLSRFEGYRDSIDSRVSPRELVRWLDRQGRISYEEGREQISLQVVTGAMTEMLEGAKSVRYSSKWKDVIVTFDQDEPMPFENLSDGQRNLLSLAGDLSMRMMRLNPQLGRDALTETPGIVLIDEIDLHLHPTWQRRVVSDLRKLFPKVQFIATTHSPFIIQTLHEGELIPLEGQSLPMFQNLSIEAISKGQMGVDHPEVAPRYLEMKDVAKTYLELLQSAKAAGPSEREEIDAKLRQSIKPYADNPAFQAFLELERLASKGE